MRSTVSKNNITITLTVDVFGHVDQSQQMSVKMILPDGTLFESDEVMPDEMGTGDLSIITQFRYCKMLRANMFALNRMRAKKEIKKYQIFEN